MDISYIPSEKDREQINCYGSRAFFELLRIEDENARDIAVMWLIKNYEDKRGIKIISEPK